MRCNSTSVRALLALIGCRLGGGDWIPTDLAIMVFCAQFALRHSLRILRCVSRASEFNLSLRATSPVSALSPSRS